MYVGKIEDEHVIRAVLMEDIASESEWRAEVTETEYEYNLWLYKEDFPIKLKVDSEPKDAEYYEKEGFTVISNIDDKRNFAKDAACIIGQEHFDRYNRLIKQMSL